MIRFLVIAVLLFNTHFCFAQKCETFKRELFHDLPKNIPNEINCVDSLGRKQGWWIYYEVQYNPYDKPDVLEKGDYVENYVYGKYKDDKKIGEWITINNVHLIYQLRIDNYAYNNDTIIIKSGFWDGGWKETTQCYYSGNSKIRYSITYDKGVKDLCIECDKSKKPKSNSCKMTYRKKLIKKFPLDQFEIELGKSDFMYNREKAIIDRSYEK